MMPDGTVVGNGERALVSCKPMLGGALRADGGEQPGGAEDRDDFDGIVAETVDKAEWADDQLAQLRLAALRDDPARLRTLPQAVGCMDEALHNQVGIQGRGLRNMFTNRLEVSDGTR